ncbi:MAG TPA: hypothetical protein VFZ31_03945 [Vicinamibacterales bacterium]
MNDEARLRWEWRAFAPELPVINVDLPPGFEATDETYLVSPESQTRAVITGNRIAADLLERDRDGVQLWRRTVDAAFPLCQRDVRETLRQFPVGIPTLYRPEYTPFEFVTDVATCTSGLRVVGVRGVRRQVAADDCLLERSTLSMAGRTLQTIAVEGDDPDAVARLVHRLRLFVDGGRNIVDVIKELLGVERPRPGFAHAF